MSLRPVANLGEIKSPRSANALCGTPLQDPSSDRRAPDAEAPRQFREREERLRLGGWTGPLDELGQYSTNLGKFGYENLKKL